MVPPSSPICLRKEFRHLRIAAAHVEHAVAFCCVFDGLLPGQGCHTDDAMVGGVEALDKSDEALSAGFRNVHDVEIFGKGTILAMPILERLQPLEVTAKLIAAFLQGVMLPAKMFSAELAGLQACFFYQVPEDRRLAVNKLRAQFDHFVADGWLRILPPTRFRASTTCTRNPADASCRAAVRPAIPAPNTMTSWLVSGMASRMRRN